MTTQSSWSVLYINALIKTEVISRLNHLEEDIVVGVDSVLEGLVARDLRLALQEALQAKKIELKF